MVPKNLSLTVPSILICVIFAISPELRAQSFDDGLRFYRNEQYRQAVQVFDSLDSPRARLFSGKSYFGLGAYLKAKSHLRQVGRNVEREVYLESLYTLALTDFRLKQFGSALNHLFMITRENRYTQLISDARQLYVDILNYLTLNQRMQAFQLVDSLQVQHDLIESAFGKVDYNTAHLLLDQLVRVTRLDTTDQRIRRLQGIISDSLRYVYNIAVRNPIRAPKGMIYDIGVALPGFNSQAQGFSVSRGLYYGFLLASEEFNQRNPDKKVFLRFKNTGPEQDISEKTMTDFAWNYQVDALLGPLFSESAWDLADYAEQYQVTMLSPLANSDTLNIDNPYFYQANPTFSVHGSKMAEFAVKELGMDTLAVLAERNSLGAASALSFFERAEKLGARVAYFFLEDLEGQGYEIADYTKFFTTDSTAIDTLGYHRIDGVYAPFTGEVAPTLIDLLLLDLEAMNSEMTVLGSPEWGATQIENQRLRNRTVYFTESYYINSKSERVKKFGEDFEARFGEQPNRYAMVGYDTADFLLRALEEVENPALLKNVLRKRPFYEGLIGNIDFENSHVNQEVKVFKISEQGVEPATY